MTNNKRRPPNRPTSPIPPTMHVRLSADIWLDIFLEHYTMMLEDDDCTIDHAKEVASLRADGALEAYETRWPTIKMLPKD